MTSLRQIFAVTSINLRNIPQRLGGSAVIVIGMLCAVAVVVSISATWLGVRQVIGLSAHADRVIVINRGAQGEGGSSLPRSSAATILSAPFIRKDADGKPIASSDALAWTNVTKRENGNEGFIQVRGISANGLKLRPEIALSSGRMFAPALRELIVGRSAESVFLGLEIGDEVDLQGSKWKIVGTFMSNGSALESGALVDSETLISASHRNGWSSIVMQLESPARLAAVKDFLENNPSITVDVKSEVDYFQDLAKPLNTFLLIVTATVGIILGVGALAGAVNTMYSAVRRRKIEIATLRAIGFGATPVVVSILIESIVLACAGAIIGAAIARLTFSGNRHAAWGFVYSSTVSSGLILSAIGIALLAGLFGAVAPAVRAARLPIAVAFRRT